MIKHQRLLRASPTRQTHDRRPLGGAHGSGALKGSAGLNRKICNRPGIELGDASAAFPSERRPHHTSIERVCQPVSDPLPIDREQLMECPAGIAASIRFHARELHHLAPLLGLFGDELAEVGRRAWKCGGAPLGTPRLHPGSERAALTTVLSLSTISAGVVRHTPKPPRRMVLSPASQSKAMRLGR